VKFRHRLGLIAVAALATLGLTAGQAAAWTPSGGYTFESTDIVSVLDLPGDPTLACDELTFDTTLNADPDATNDNGNDNNGTVDDGGTSGCTSSNDPNCIVTVTFPGGDLPWSITGDDTTGGDGTVEITGIVFDVLYSGGSCSLAGLNFDVVGDVAGTYDYNAGATLDVITITSSDLEVANSNATGVIPNGTAVDLSGTAATANGPQMQ